jgi:zinc protease
MNIPLRLPELGFHKSTLTNGLDVVIRRQANLPLVAVNLWYHVGSKNEERRQRGYAHLFEHLMFEGSEHFPGDFFKPLQRLGANVNGSTSADRTTYFVDVPAAHLEFALAMESDRMGYLVPALSDVKLRTQKDVVKNEYRQNYANRPYGEVWRFLAEALYPRDHPYSWLTIGVMEDVGAATRDEVESFFRRYYVPANASLCLVGDLDPECALALAERYFGPLPGGTKALPAWLRDVELKTSNQIVLRERVELDRFYHVWPTQAHFLPFDAPLLLLADLLARGRSSRLYRKLVVEQTLAQDVTAYQSGRELAGTFGVVVTLRPGRDPEMARALVQNELGELARTGPTPEELERALNGRIAAFVYSLDNIGGFGGVADRLNAYNVYLGDPGRFAADLGRFQAVSADDIRQAAARFLVDKPSVSLTVLGRAGAAQSLDRSKPPAAPAPVAFQAPLPQERVLQNGSPLWVVPRRDLPIVAATLTVNAGAGAHGADRGGLASLTAAMMDEGTTSRSSQELARLAEDMGTSLSTTCGWDGSYVSLQCLTPCLARSLDLACDVLLNPSFPELDWVRVHGQTLAGLKAERDSADARAYRAFLRALYRANHPYRAPVDGSEPTVTKLGRNDLIEFHRAEYRPNRSAWVVAGDVDADQVARLLDERLAVWSAKPALPPQVLVGQTNGSQRLLLLDKPGAVQAVVRVGHVGLPRSHPDHDALQVLNQILGGQFSSRLNARLREEKGLTYGIRSQFDFRREAGPFLVSASLQADRIGEALSDLRREIEDLIEGRPPTAVELDDASRALVEGQARHFETPSALVARYAGLFLHNLPLDHHARLAERLSRVTLDTLREVGQRHMRPGSLIAVIVADAELVTESLDRLGWAAVERIDDLNAGEV